MALPTFIAIITLFLVPAGASAGTKFGFALGTNILASAIVYTAIAVPFGSMLFYATRSTEERSKMGITRAVFGYVIGMVLSIGYIPITNALGGDQRAWVMFATGFAVLAVIGLLAAFFANPERNPDPPSTRNNAIPFLESIGLLFGNRYWVIMLLVMLLANIIYALSSGSGIYYVKWVLGDEDLMALLGAVGLIPVVVGFAAVGPLVKRLGPAKTVRVALLVGIAGSLVRVVFPYELWALLGFGALVTLSTIPIMAVGGVLVNNTVTYGEWKFGKRQVGMANAASSFGAKVGTGIGSASIGWILALGHYDGAAAAQPDSAVTAILLISIGVPLAILIGMYALMRFYDLDDRYGQIVQELQERAESSQSPS
ncbi:sugar (glycoside-pentoside-Hexuronide) transporter [Actinomyces ruminis]|uniref:Sugar (Glycoside-pentoside-Hexuronide) transporter n=1 Tax=Actinomyces ruminis TaxID=1937003 RepID=A0ABX4MD44_9ACTO|nr:MFS transporter [Actinomyces ruminis]PHP53374.1 sugar (glycoside-pentoside-Hexuronide) transporter [Actinomyces ruminis]